MKYSKPGLHFLSATNAAAHCIDGSNPADLHLCTTGLEFTNGTCASGSGARINCGTGLGADTGCAVGDRYGDDCIDGGIAG